MSRLIAGKDNCTIRFQVQDSVTVDGDGYPIISSTSTDLRARVYNDDGTTKKDVFPEGIDLEGEMLWGRLESPRTFPATIKDLAVVTVIFDDGRTGTGRIRIKTQNTLIGDRTVIGERFDLLFRAT